MEIIRKFMVLTPMAIGYALLNGFYEQEAFDTITHCTFVENFVFSNFQSFILKFLK